MKRLLLLAVCVAMLAPPAAAQAQFVAVGPGGGTPGTSDEFELIGHEPLFGRGMNAAPAIYRDFVYIGNRTDGSPQHPHPGIEIVDVSDPAAPEVVGEIGPPHAAQVGITTRELRVWPEEKLLMVMTFSCSALIHDCPPTPPGVPSRDAAFPFDIKAFDLSDPVHPRFISSYVPTSQAGMKVKPHEMYLWIDPRDDDRALLWLSTPEHHADPTMPNLLIVDISDVSDGGAVTEVAEGTWNHLFPGAENPANYDDNLALHSMAPTVDGKRTYLALLRGGFLVLNTTDVAKDRVPEGEVESLNDDLLTPVGNRPIWGESLANCPGGTPKGCSEGHSAVPVPGRRFALTTDEVYGTYTTPSFGWPWGWARLIDVSPPTRPRIVSEYKIIQNTEMFGPLPADDPTQQFTSYSSHNPTLTRELALIAWHSGGLQAIDLDAPRRPAQGGWFSPTPLAAVATEDPALSDGPNKVVMWSYPIVKDGLIYVMDIRNGLYILRYTGPQASEVSGLSFLEGNSNLGDAERVARHDD